MTSTSVNIGITGNKNSSRVLKPPGGGHTDIFGIKAASEIKIHDKQPNVQEKSNEPILDENTIIPLQDSKNKDKKDIPEPPRRVRVPPGGFSSGLW
ncbi:uncharacterized protein LOC114324818 [Diabrotica virgifera virgifera]|uniref:Microtubule-associated protein Jupiter n=1 Tax=Diabrotica virgifera virgifera TaxID=50390 RepID=A0A6P7EZP9_DIAVI|nr:uncharacterized protein LOC114324818 [Diabrotica virgifera virgifera]